VRIKPGIFNLGFPLERFKRAIPGTLEAVSRTVHVIWSPAFSASGVQANRVGLIPNTDSGIDLCAPCIAALIWNRRSWSEAGTAATNCADFVPAGILTWAGIWTCELSTCKLTVVSEAAGWSSATVQASAPVALKSGLQARVEIGLAPTLMTRLRILLPSVTVIWKELPPDDGAVTEKLALVRPAGTVTEFGRFNPSEPDVDVIVTTISPLARDNDKSH
jgi:hypothetical protein